MTTPSPPSPVSFRRAVRRWLHGVIPMVLLAATLAACANIEIGPVDHACPTNPRKANMGSGCGGGGGH